MKGLKVLSLGELKATYDEWQREDETKTIPASSDLAQLDRRRFLVGEAEEGHQFSASRVKEFSGGDTLRGRLLGGA